MTLELRALLLSGAFPFSVTGGDQTVSLDVAGESGQGLGALRISSGIYRGLRVVISEVRADLTAGLESEGVPAGGIVSVDLGPDEEAVIELDSDLVVPEGTSLDILVEVRAPIWLANVVGDPGPFVVTEEEFLDALVVRAELN